MFYGRDVGNDEEVCRRRGDECCIGGGVVGEGVMSVA